ILSVMSCSPAEMKIFSPVMLNEPSAFGVALVRSKPRSVPQCDSVKHIVPDHSPVIIFGRYVCFCSVVPCVVRHALAPLVRPGYMQNELSADEAIPEMHRPGEGGKPWPPYSGSAAIEVKPASQYCLYASLKPFGVFTPSGLQVQPSSSPLRLSGATVVSIS